MKHIEKEKKAEINKAEEINKANSQNSKNQRNELNARISESNRFSLGIDIGDEKNEEYKYYKLKNSTEVLA